MSVGLRICPFGSFYAPFFFLGTLKKSSSFFYHYPNLSISAFQLVMKKLTRSQHNKRKLNINLPNITLEAIRS